MRNNKRHPSTGHHSNYTVSLTHVHFRVRIVRQCATNIALGSLYTVAIALGFRVLFAKTISSVYILI